MRLIGKFLFGTILTQIANRWRADSIHFPSWKIREKKPQQTTTKKKDTNGLLFFLFSFIFHFFFTKPFNITPYGGNDQVTTMRKTTANDTQHISSFSIALPWFLTILFPLFLFFFFTSLHNPNDATVVTLHRLLAWSSADHIIKRRFFLFFRLRRPISFN